MAATFVRWYTTHLEKRPVLTQAIMSFVVTGLGDIFAQQVIEGRGAAHQWSRTARVALFGLAVGGPIISQWYRFMDKNIRFSNVFAQTVARVVADQTIISPLFLTGFLYYNDVAAGRGHDYAVLNIQQKFWPTLLNNYKVWPAVHMVNFLVVPVQHRLLVTNTVGVFWNAYLTYTANRGLTTALPTTPP